MVLIVYLLLPEQFALVAAVNPPTGGDDVRSVKFLFISLVVLSTVVQAGVMEPKLVDWLDEMPADQPVSVIVHMAEQAPITQLDAELRAMRATRQHRHQVVVEALQAATLSQEPLKAYLDARIAEGSVESYKSHWITNLLAISAYPVEIQLIAARSDVDRVVANFLPGYITREREEWPCNIINPEDDDDREREIGVTTSIRSIGAPKVWYELGITGQGRIVANFDSGADHTHPALASNWRGNHAPWEECWLDLHRYWAFPIDPPDDLCTGTPMMGTMVGAAEGDTIGVAWGADWIACKLLPMRGPDWLDLAVIEAFEWVTDPDGDPTTVDDVPDVLANGWGVWPRLYPHSVDGEIYYEECDPRWWDIIDNCEAAGVVTLWSIGKTRGAVDVGYGTIYPIGSSPANRASTATSSFSVGWALAEYPPNGNPPDRPYVMRFSQYGPTVCEASDPLRIKPEIVAPGAWIVTAVPTWTGELYDRAEGGPDLSTAHVAGTVALMREADPDLDVQSIKEFLLSTALDIGVPGEDNFSGHGFLNAYAAVQMVLDHRKLRQDSPGGIYLARLHSNHPNPLQLGMQTIIRFNLYQAADVRLQVFDVTGRLVKTLMHGQRNIGTHTTIWDGRDQSGNQMSAGVYFYRLEAGGFTESRRLVLVK